MDTDRKSLWPQVGRHHDGQGRHKPSQTCVWTGGMDPKCRGSQDLTRRKKQFEGVAAGRPRRGAAGTLARANRRTYFLVDAPRLPLELRLGQDHWSSSTLDSRAEVYVPQPHKCHDFSLDDLANQKRTHRNEAEEQPADDQ